jgi:uncharacterized protein (PEP-CTERM system associated)
MVIDPRRFRRGHAGQFVFSSKVVAAAAVAISGQFLPGAARSQLIVDPGGSFQQPWRYSASMGVDETWSDNINLSPAGMERSDFVTTISPTFQMSRSGPRLNVTFDYAPQYLIYAKGTNGSGLRNSLSATANASLIENLLFFDASTNISQTNISPFGTQAANTVNGSTNRTEARSYSFGPTLRSRLQQDLSYVLAYHYTATNAASSAIAASHTTDFSGSVQTSTSFRDLGVGASFDRSEQGYGGTNQIVTESASVNLTYVLLPTIHLRANAGFEHDQYPTVGDIDQTGASYSAGFDWEPSRHTTLNVTVGHRPFGTSANVSLAEATRLFSLSGSYGRDQSVSSGSGLALTPDPNYQLLDQALRATITDPTLRAQAVTATLAQNGLPTSQYATSSFYSNQVYLQRHLNLSLALLGQHNTVTFDASRSDSQGLSNLAVGFDIFNQAQRFRTASYSANWSHALGPRTNVNATFQKTHNYAVEGVGDTRQRVLIASINRAISKNVSANALYRNTTQTGSADSTGFYGGNYRENAVLGSLRVNF